MTLPPLTYLATDSLAEGIGTSQVLAYVERLADRGVDVNLHTFEKQAPPPLLRRRLSDRAISWHPHPFGTYGSRGGMKRVFTGARAVHDSPLVHARSDLAAASALMGRCRNWVWDVRSLWADQRIAIGSLRRDGAEHRMLRRIEGAAARRSSAIVTLTQAVIPVLEHRYRLRLDSKAFVIPTCVDTQRFRVGAMPPRDPVVLLLAGTLNPYYDVPLMTQLVERWQRRRRVEFRVLSPGATPWDTELARLAAVRATAAPEQMPGHVSGAHVGLSICRSDAGVSLTAAMPTKIAEFLAAGRPVVVNANLGDAGRLILESNAGIALQRGDDLEAALDRLDALLEDPETPSRCRALAEHHFDLDNAVERLIEIYARIAAQSGSS